MPRGFPLTDKDNVEKLKERYIQHPRCTWCGFRSSAQNVYLPTGEMFCRQSHLDEYVLAKQFEKEYGTDPKKIIEEERKQLLRPIRDLYCTTSTVTATGKVNIYSAHSIKPLHLRPGDKVLVVVKVLSRQKPHEPVLASASQELAEDSSKLCARHFGMRKRFCYRCVKDFLLDADALDSASRLPKAQRVRRSSSSSWNELTRESGLKEWQCSHGVGHPDEDSAVEVADKYGEWKTGSCTRDQAIGAWMTHGCDGCCSQSDFPGRKAVKLKEEDGVMVTDEENDDMAADFDVCGCGHIRSVHDGPVCTVRACNCPGFYSEVEDGR